MREIEFTDNMTSEDTEEAFQNISLNRFMAVVEDPTEMLYPWRYQPSILISVGVHCTVFLVGVTGHILMLIYLFTTNIRKHNITTGIFLASLSAAELLLLFVYIPLEIWKTLWPQVAKGGAICAATEYIKMLTAAGSVINLAAVSLERYIVVVHPIRSKMLCTRPKCIVSVITVWFLSSLLSLPVLLTNDVYSIVYVNEERTTSVEVFICTDDKESGSAPWVGRAVSLYQLFVLLIIPLILSTGCYQAVIRVLWRSVRNVHTMSNCSSLRNGHRARCYSFRPTNTNNVQIEQPSSSASVGSQHSQEGIKMSLTAVRAHRLGKQLGESSLQPPTQTGSPATQAVQQTGKRSSQPDQPNQPCQCNQGWLAAQKINNGRKNIIKLLILILVMYFLCWGTWLTAKLIMWWAGNTSLPYSPAFYRFSVIAKHLPAIHATINPIIYSIMSGNFRKQLCICRTEEP